MARWLCAAAALGAACAWTHPVDLEGEDFVHAALRDDWASVRALAHRPGARVNERSAAGWTALTFAVRADQREVARLLLERGADPDTRENERGLAHSGPDEYATVNGSTVLAHARSAAMARLLLERGARADAANAEGFTPIHWSSAEVALVLLEHGVDPNARQAAARAETGRLPSDELTPLMTAARHGRSEKVHVLLAAGADIAARDRRGRTALHEAARATSDAHTLRLLLAAGADANARSAEGRTPIMEAASSGALEAVAVLLAAGARTSHCDRDGMNAADHLAALHAAPGGTATCPDPDCEALLARLRRDAGPACKGSRATVDARHVKTPVGGFLAGLGTQGLLRLLPFPLAAAALAFIALRLARARRRLPGAGRARQWPRR